MRFMSNLLVYYVFQVKATTWNFHFVLILAAPAAAPEMDLQLVAVVLGGLMLLELTIPRMIDLRYLVTFTIFLVNFVCTYDKINYK